MPPMMTETLMRSSKPSSKRSLARLLLDEPRSSRALHKSAPLRKKEAGSLSYRSSKGMMRHQPSSSKNATWGDLKTPSSAQNASWATFKKNPAESSSSFYSRTTTHCNNTSCIADVHSAMENKLERGIEELMLMLQSSNFIGKIDPKFHAPYLTPGMDAGAASWLTDAATDAEEQEVGVDASTYESIIGNSFAVIMEKQIERTPQENDGQPAVRNSLFKKKTTATRTAINNKRRISIVYESHRVSKKCEGKRLRTVLSSPEMVPLASRRSRLYYDSFENFRAVLV